MASITSPLYITWHGRRYGRPGSRGRTHAAERADGREINPPRSAKALCGRRWDESEMEVGGGIEPVEGDATPTCRACRKKLETAR